MALFDTLGKYEAVFLEQMNDAFIAINSNWIITQVNTRASRLLNRTREELLHQCICDLNPDGFADDFCDQLRKVFVEQVNVQFRTFDRMLEIWFEVHAYPVETGIYMLFQEVENQKSLEPEEEFYYRSLFLQNPDAVYLMDLDGNFLEVNPSAEKMLGCTRTALLKSNFRLFCTPSEIDKTNRHFQLACAGIPQRYELNIVTRDGSMRVIDVSNVPISIDGRVVGVYGISKDITERKQIEGALRLSERGLAQSQRIAQVGHWELDLKTDALTCSKETLRIFGGEAMEEAIPSEVPFSMIHPDDRRTVKEAFEQAIKGEPLRLEHRIIRPDGMERVLLMQGHAVGDDRSHVFGIVQDITEQKRTEQLIMENQMRYRSLLAYNSDGVVALDLHGHYIEVNPAFERMTGYTKEELLQMSHKQLIPFDQTELEQVKASWESMIQEGVPYSLEHPIKHKDGYFFEVNSHNIPIIINGNITGYFTICRDISERKRTEEILRKSDKLAAVGQLAAAVAHEIRNPLTSLKGFTKLLQDHFPQEKKQYFDIMLSELARIEMISGELLVLAKPQVKHYDQRNVNEILLSVVALLESQANMNNVEVELKLDLDLPFLQCEENQLKQVFVNIIKNGIEAMKQGGKLLISSERHGLEARLCFVDHGCGIPPDIIHKIGEPFYSTKEKGTGLGMMITNKIINHHKGRLEIESEPDKGTTIRVFLPIFHDE